MKGLKKILYPLSKNPTTLKIRLHAFIIGVIYCSLITLGLKVDMRFIDVAGGLSILQAMSLLSNFCPIYFVLNYFIKDKEKILDGSQD